MLTGFFIEIYQGVFLPNINEVISTLFVGFTALFRSLMTIL